MAHSVTLPGHLLRAMRRHSAGHVHLYAAEHFEVYADTRVPMAEAPSLPIISRVAGTHCCVPAPSEPCKQLFTAHGSSTPDFLARRADGTGLVVDVRPDDRISPKDAAKFTVTAAVCRSVGRI